MSIPRLVVEDELPIPAYIRDATGHEVDLRNDLWRLNIVDATLRLDWNKIADCDNDAVAALKVHIIRLIEMRSARHVSNTFRIVADFLMTAKQNGTEPLTLLGLIRHLERLRAAKRGYQFHYLRQWYEASCDRYLAGFDDDVAFAIRDIRVEGNVKGEAVLSSDPEEGPLSEFEEEAVRSALLRDDGPIQERAALWLALAFGTNPANLALLQEQDFVTQEFADGSPKEFTLKIPRIKKRGTLRSEFKPRYVAPHLAGIISELVVHNREIAASAPVRPLFRTQQPRDVLVAGPLKRFANHHTATGITSLITRCVERLGVVSPRTGRALRITTRRLRYTFACKMVRQGVADIDLAELLDHTDTQNVQIYYKSDSRFTDRLDATVAKHIGPMVQAFAGQVVEREGTVIDLIPFCDLPDLGQCGASFVCGLSAPKNCYTCTRFNAFSDGPHEAVLQSLIAERDDLIERGQERIAEQLDRTILAVGEVVTRISGDAA